MYLNKPNPTTFFILGLIRKFIFIVLYFDIMGRNKHIQCKICLKSFRSDNLKSRQGRHESKSKYRMNNCSICQKTMIAGHLARHMKTHNNSNVRPIFGK